MGSPWNREDLDKALEALAESAKDYVRPPSAMCYSMIMPRKKDFLYNCDMCGRRSVLEVNEYFGDDGPRIRARYQALADEFAEAGCQAVVVFLCDLCAQEEYPSKDRDTVHNIVFYIDVPGKGEQTSFPDTEEYNDTAYRVALAFLRGADTVQKLAEETGTEMTADEYFGCIREVLGIEPPDRRG